MAYNVLFCSGTEECMSLENRLIREGIEIQREDAGNQNIPSETENKERFERVIPQVEDFMRLRDSFLRDVLPFVMNNTAN